MFRQEPVVNFVGRTRSNTVFPLPNPFQILSNPVSLLTTLFYFNLLSLLFNLSPPLDRSIDRNLEQEKKKERTLAAYHEVARNPGRNFFPPLPARICVSARPLHATIDRRDNLSWQPFEMVNPPPRKQLALVIHQQGGNGGNSRERTSSLLSILLVSRVCSPQFAQFFTKFRENFAEKKKRNCNNVKEIRKETRKRSRSDPLDARIYPRAGHEEDWNGNRIVGVPSWCVRDGVKRVSYRNRGKGKAWRGGDD